jgi:hypothetical protein
MDARRDGDGWIPRWIPRSGERRAGGHGASVKLEGKAVNSDTLDADLGHVEKRIIVLGCARDEHSMAPMCLS